MESKLFDSDEEPVPRKTRQIKEPVPKKDDLVIEGSDSERSEGEIMDHQNTLASAIFGADLNEELMDIEDTVPTGPGQVFEPAEIKEKFATADQKAIRDSEVPERLQSALKGRMHPTEDELVLETEWLLQRLQATTSSINEDALRIKIRKFLQLYRITKYEVPFISRYRRHYLEPDLEIKHLWDLYFWDMEWGNVYETKKVYGETIRKAAENAATLQVNDEVIEPSDKILVTISKPGELPEDVNTLLDYNNHEKAT